MGRGERLDVGRLVPTPGPDTRRGRTGTADASPMRPRSTEGSRHSRRLPTAPASRPCRFLFTGMTTASPSGPNSSADSVGKPRSSASRVNWNAPNPGRTVIPRFQPSDNPRGVLRKHSPSPLFIEPCHRSRTGEERRVERFACPANPNVRATETGPASSAGDGRWRMTRSSPSGFRSVVDTMTA